MTTPPARLDLSPALLRATFAPLGKVLNPRVSVAVQRRVVAAALTPLPSAPGVRVRPDTVGGVPGRRMRLRNGARAGALLYLHGGGYVVGSARGEQSLATYLAAGLELDGFAPDYRLAPEHPFPAALDDALAAYEGLLAEGVPAGRIVVAGESAGGGLSLALAVTLRERGLPLPLMLGLLCPWVDLTPEAVAGFDSRAALEPLIDSAIGEQWAAAYGGTRRHDPQLSPLHADLSGLPPVVIESGENDPATAHAIELERRLREAGVDVRHDIHPGMSHGFVAACAVSRTARDAIEAVAARGRELLAPAAHPRVVIIGAGMSGICMGRALLQAGIEDFIIYEGAESVGGTWQATNYPGLSCDVPARHYCYSFRPNPDWSAVYAPGPELQRYFEDCASEFGLLPKIRLSTRVEEADWDGSRWQLRLADGTTDSADVLVCATGVLRYPRKPDIPGLDSFEGPSFHSAEWDHSVPVDGRRIGVIGSGSTGVQIVTALSTRASKVVSIQRTPQWVLPIPQMQTSELGRALRRRFPALDRASYRGWQFTFDNLFGAAPLKDGLGRKVMSGACYAYLRLGVRDRALREQIRPNDLPLCKRIVMSGSYYKAIQRPTVDVVTADVARIDPKGIVTTDGRLHEVDVIVLATGYHPWLFMRPMQIRGEEGITLDQAWNPAPQAYLSVSMPGFPNLFTLLGPHSPFGNISLTAITETQVSYVMRLIELIRAGEITAAAPTASATDRLQREIRDAFPGTIWTSGCATWYLDASGLPELWPWTPKHHREAMAAPDLSDFELSRNMRVDPATDPQAIFGR